MRKLIPLQRHILEEKVLPNGQKLELARLFWDFMIAIKKIHNKVIKAGLVDILGESGDVNVHGETVQRLDEYAHEAVFKAMNHGGHLCTMVSEESEDIIPIPTELPLGPYVLVFDPLDGSSNLDANVSVGTIFSVYRRRSEEGPGRREDVVRAGAEQICAGYVIYGSSTMLVYTVGTGVHGFTLDPAMGEFYLSHPSIQIPPRGGIYSINEGYSNSFDEQTKR
ncbi:MAG: class 1 fructose-bisphosphatase, partial [Patescibacteria group bacterium]